MSKQTWLLPTEFKAIHYTDVCYDGLQTSSANRVVILDQGIELLPAPDPMRPDLADAYQDFSWGHESFDLDPGARSLARSLIYDATKDLGLAAIYELCFVRRVVIDLQAEFTIQRSYVLQQLEACMREAAKPRPTNAQALVNFIDRATAKRNRARRRY